MKQKTVAFILVLVLIMTSGIISGSAKEVSSLTDIAAKSKLEPVKGVALNAVTELSEVKSNALPSSYSSRDLGYTTEVRQQSSNICWAYSSLASLETLLLKSGEHTGHLAPEHINIWGSMEDSGLGWQRTDLVNDGGYSYIAMGYLTSWSGPLNDSDFPIGTDKAKSDITSNLYSPKYGVTSVKYITQSTPIETVKSYIMDYGSAVANFNADTVKYMNSSSDSFYCSDSKISTSSLYGHAVSIVGWDDNYPKESFSTSASGDTPKNDGAWLIKNSWGKYVNANGGYFWISYEDAWIFHEIFGPSFAISGYEKLNGSEHLYQNEVYGATSEFTYLTDEDTVAADSVTYINVFDFEGETLDKVMFESTSFDADYTVYYIPVYEGKPTVETHLWTQIGKGTVDYTGYIIVDTKDMNLPNGKGAIGISVDNTRTYTQNKANKDYEYISNSIGVCEWLAYSGGYYFKHQAKQGESFVIYNDSGTTQYYDLTDFYDKYLDDDMGATFVIKAISKGKDYVSEFSSASTAATQETESQSTTVKDNTIALGITLEFLGDTSLTVFAHATGDNGEYEFEFKVNDTLLQSYSSENYVGINFTTDGKYTVKVSARDSDGRVITTQSEIIVTNGKIAIEGQTDPGENSSEASSSASATAYLMGDTDFNGTISIKDTTLIRKYLAKIIDFDEITLAVSDVDSNGKCSIKDATAIQKYLALIETDSTVGKTVFLYF